MVPLTPHLHRSSKLLAALSLAFLQSLIACDVAETSSGAGGSSGIGGGSPAAGGSSTAGTKNAGGDSSAIGGAGGGGGSATGTFRVEAGKLYDRCGEQVVLRGGD